MSHVSSLVHWFASYRKNRANMPFLLAAAVPKELWANHLKNYQLSLHGKTSRKKGGKRCSLKKILHQTILFSAHQIAQPWRYTVSEAFQAVKAVCDIYTVLNLECYKRARIRFQCANCLVILRTLEGRLVRRHLNRGCTCSSILGLFLEERNSLQIFFPLPPTAMSGAAFP